MSLHFDFNGRTAVISGGARGIGLELSRRFAEAGAHVVAVDLSESPQESECHAPPDNVRFVQGDVSEAEDAERVIRAAIDWRGAIDILINNAGITRDGVVWKLSDDDWRSVLDVHLTGSFNLTRAAIPWMRKAEHGRIINVTSYTGLRGNFGQSNYAAAKAGIIGFTKTVAKEVARFGITVNAISPNARTAMTSAIPDAARDELTAMIPMRRFGEAREMWPAFGFLSSDEAAYVTGAVLPVDGGLSV